jgi:hypothetical protein
MFLRTLVRKGGGLAALVSIIGLAMVVAGGAAGGSGPAKFTATPLTADTTFAGGKSLSGSYAETDPSLLGRSDSTPVNVMVKYDFDATASYTGGVAGLAPTSPSVTGVALADNQSAVNAYDSYTAGVTQEISKAADAAVPGLDIGASYQTVYGGVSATLPANQVSDLLKVPGVAAVQKDALNQPLDDNTSFIGATNVWPTLGGQDNAGSNTVIGVIDTGLWPEHPMLADHGLSAPPKPLSAYHCDFGDGSDAAHLGPAFTCNNKLIGAYAFTAGYLANHGSDGHEFCNDATHKCSARDSEGHGTHTTTTAAGDRVDHAVLYGVDRGPLSGIAPGAHVIMYRVCLSAGCFSSDSVAAVNQAISDGVNVINFSISGGANPYSDPVELAFLDATNAGISVNASAGNSGPSAATAEHGGPWVTTVGASTGPRFFTSTLHLTADGGASLDVPGVTLTNGISSATPVVLAQNIPGEDALCQTKLGALSPAAGKIVLCQRGGNARVEKGFNVFSGGAVAMILYNHGVQDLETDNHWLPAIHLDGPDTALLAFVNGHTNVLASFAQGNPTATTPDVMASFSSRGPVGDWIKPDVTAPGIQVLAGMTPQPDQTTPVNGPSGNLYQAIAGTSMASPHAAGVSLLVKAAHPSWTPAEIKSALMTSSVQSVVKEDGTTATTPFDAGAGSIRADRAVNPTLVFDETYADFVAAGADPLHRIDLNIASIDATTMTGSITTNRTAINVSGKHQNLQVQITQPAGVTITVGKKNKNLHIDKDGTLTFPITISAPEVANGQYFGAIDLVPVAGGNTVHIPVAFVKRQGNVSLTHLCSPTTVAVKALIHCTATVTNLSSVTANAALSIVQQEKTGKALNYVNIGAPGSVIGAGDGVQWGGPLSPQMPPQVTSLTAGSGPAGGYLPLSAFGIAPIAGVGDDTITNLNVPAFYYGGESYSRIGVVSNGYLVIGGGTSSDIVFTPQHFPNAARPNNVLSPLWSDLNPPGAGAIRAGTLTDGSNTWIIVDWAGVKNFGNATTHTFEVWIQVAGGAAGTGPSSEQITFSYNAGTTNGGNSSLGDPDSGQNWGAENRDGSSGANIATAPANGSEYVVHTTPPTAGGSVTIPFDVWSKKPNTYHSQASMTSDQTPGVTQVFQTLTITPTP